MRQARFHIIPPADHTVMPWRNGGGTTREIIKQEEHGRLLWRLSIADVERDGPFSAFPGLSRVLTVIEGAGLNLVSPRAALQARLLEPVAFLGDEAIEGRLVEGPVRDFNVIFDASRVEARVSILHALAESRLDVAGQTAILVLDGGGSVNARRCEMLTLVILSRGAHSIELSGPAIRVDIRLLEP